MASPPSPPSPPGGQSPPDLSAQIEATKQLTAAMAALLQQIGKTNQGLRDQSDISGDLSDLLDDISDQREKEEKQAKERQEQLEKEIKNIKSIGDVTGLLSKKLKEAAEGSKKMAVGMAAVSGAAKGFKAGISLMNGVLGAMGGILTTLIGTVFDLGIAILTGPIKMFNALFAKAKAGMSGASELAQALEKVRENFGDIYSGLGGTVASMGTQLSHGLIAPGLSAAKVFGSVAEATNYANEMASQAPAAFQKLSAQFQDSALEALAMAKGLGISKEEFAGLMNVAVSSGRDIVDIETEMTKFAKGMASEFKLNSKMISRDMGRAMKDVKHFANLTVKELAKAATYAQGLGLELKDITGILDAFNTFESAAENVSKLSQAFGVNLDTMKLLEAESPDEQIAHVKQAFEAAGKSADQMNRRELQLLAQTLNMDEAMVRQALSTKNAGISMDKVKASSAGLEGQTMSTAEAMKALSKDIERVIKSGEPPKGDNFIEVFLEGVMEGMERTAAFRQLMLNMMRSIHAVRQAGRELGAQLMEVVPGLKDMIKGLAELVAPDKLGGMFRAFSRSFVEFFQTLKSGGVASVKDLVENLKKNFLDYLTAAGPGGQSFLKGLSDMWEAAKKIIVSAIEYLGEILESGINLLTDILTGKFNAQASSIAGGIMGEFAPIIDAFSKLFSKLKEPVLTLLETVFNIIVDKIGGFLRDNWAIILGGYLSFAFIGAFANAFAAATGAAIMQTVILPFLKSLAAKIIVATTTTTSINAATAPLGPLATQTALQAAAPFDIAGATFLKMAAFMGAALLAVGLILIAVRKANITPTEVMTAAGIAGAAGILALTSAGVVMMVASISPAAVAAGGVVGAALPILAGVTLGILGLSVLLLSTARAYSDVTVASIGKVILVLAATSLLVLAAAGIAAVAASVGSILVGTGGIAYAAIGAGMIALGTIISAMIGTAYLILEEAKTIESPSKVESMTKLIMAVGGLYIKTMPVMGAILKAIELVAAGPSALSGFKKLEDIINSIIGTANNVIIELNKLPADAASLKNKVEPFISVMKSITDMIKSIGVVLNSAKSSGSEDLSKAADKNPFDGAAEFISGLVGDSGKKTGIIGVLESIKGSIKILQEVPASTVKAFAEILLSVSKLLGEISNIVKSFTLKHKESGLFGSEEYDKENAFAQNSFHLRTFIEVALPPMSALIRAIAEALKDIDPSKAEAVAQSASAIGQVLSAVSSLIESLGKNLKDFTKKSKYVTGGAIADDVEEFENFDSESYSRYITVFTEKLEPMLKKIQDFMGSTVLALAQSLSGIDMSKMEALKPMTEMITSIMSVVQSLYSSMSNPKLVVENEKVMNKSKQQAVGKIADSITYNLTTTFPKIEESLDAIQKKAPAIFKVIGDAVNAFQPAPGAAEKAKTLKEGMESIAAIIKGLNDMTSAAPTETDGKKLSNVERVNALVKNALVAGVFLRRLIEKKDGVSILGSLTKTLDEVPAAPKASSIASLKSLKDGLTSISEVTNVMGTLGDLMPKKTLNLPNAPVVDDPDALRLKIHGQINVAKLLIQHLSDKDKGIPSLDEAISTANSNLKGSGQGLAQLMSKLTGYSQVKDLSPAVAAIASALPKEAADASLGALDKSLADFEKRLDSVVGTRPVEIQAKLKNTLGQLGLKGAKYTVDAKPIALTVNLNVTMSAGDVAAGIASAPTIIRSRIEQLATRAGVQGYDISQSIPTPSS